MALEKMRTYYTPDEELALPDENQRFEQEWSDPRTLAALGEGEGGLSALEATAGAFAKRKMDVPYALRKAIQEKTPIDPRATMEFIESGKQALADKLPPVTPYPVSKTVTFPRALAQAVNKQGLVGDLKAPVAMPETMPSLSMPSGAPAKTSDLAALQKLMSPGSLASPIPVASAPVKADVPGALKGTIPATTPTQPAPPADGSGGDDDVRNLYLARLAAQSAAGFGGMGAGKNIDMGIADTLGERMKQIEALRAKREERSADVSQEQAQYEGANLGTLTSNIAAFKDRPEVVAALENLRPAAKYTKPSDFLKAAYQAVMNPPTLAGKEAGVEKTGAQTAQVQERTTTEKEIRPGKVRKLKTAADLDEARIRALNTKATADALALTKSRAAVADAGKAGTPSKDAIKYIRDDLKTAEKAITPTLENFKAIEAASPGFAFGRPDKELETLEFVAAAKLPRFAKQASDLRSAVEALIIDIRHGSFGASLTATEKASFESMLNTGLSGTVGQLSKAIDRVRRKAAATAQTHFNTSQQFYPTETRQVLSTSAVFGPATRKGGVYADVWTLPEAPAAGGGAGTRQQKPTASEGYTTLWNKTQGKWQEIPNEKAEAAKASGRFEE